MDDVALETLWREMKADISVAFDAAKVVRERFAERTASGFDSAAHHLCRFFNVIEQMSLRVAKAFENNIDDERGWHAQLIRRMTLDITGMRPALFPRSLAPALDELRSFRHMFVHAYDLEIDPEKLEFTLRYLDRVTASLDEHALRFIEGVAALHGLTPPP